MWLWGGRSRSYRAVIFSPYVLNFGTVFSFGWACFCSRFELRSDHAGIPQFSATHRHHRTFPILNCRSVFCVRKIAQIAMLLWGISVQDALRFLIWDLEDRLWWLFFFWDFLCKRIVVNYASIVWLKFTRNLQPECGFDCTHIGACLQKVFEHKTYSHVCECGAEIFSLFLAWFEANFVENYVRA